MPRGQAIWIQSSALPPAPSGGTSLTFAGDLILPFADLSLAQDCAQELVAVLKRHRFSAEIRTWEPASGGTSIPRGHGIWIQASALPPLPPGGATLQFARDLVLPFADASAARTFAHEIVSVLDRYGLKTKIRTNYVHSGGIAIPRGSAIWIQANALPPAPSGGTSLAFASDLILPFADLSAAQDCVQELVNVLNRHHFTADIRTNEPALGGTSIAHGQGIWIQANALPPLPPGGVIVQFAGDLVLPFAAANAAHACAQEIVSTLSRHGLKTEIRTT